MRKELVLALVLALTLVGGALMPVVAQDKPPVPVPMQPVRPASTARRCQADSSEGHTHPLEVHGGEENQQHAVCIGGADERTKDQPPHGGPGAGHPDGVRPEGRGARIPQSSYTYRDVGTNIDCNALDIGNGLFNLTITVEDSTIQLDRPESPQEKDAKKTLGDIPAFRSFRASFGMVLRDGQTMQYASATDPISGEVVRVDVNLTMAK